MATRHEKTGQRERIEARRERVWKLRLAGASMSQIAMQEGCNSATVCRDVNAVLGRLRKEQNQDAATSRDLELARLDKLLLACWGDSTNPAAKGRNFSIDRALSIMERRAKLLGLDAPVHFKLDSELSDAMPILMEIINLLRPQNIKFAEAQQQFFDMLQAKQAATNAVQSEVKS